MSLFSRFFPLLKFVDPFFLFTSDYNFSFFCVFASRIFSFLPSFLRLSSSLTLSSPSFTFPPVPLLSFSSSSHIFSPTFSSSLSSSFSRLSSPFSFTSFFRLVLLSSLLPSSRLPLHLLPYDYHFSLSSHPLSFLSSLSPFIRFSLLSSFILLSPLSFALSLSLLYIIFCFFSFVSSFILFFLCLSQFFSLFTRRLRSLYFCFLIYLLPSMF